MNTENMRQHFESDGSPARIVGGTSVVVSPPATGSAPSRIPTRPICARCQRYITIDTHADNDLWEEVIGERFGPGYICADCFTRAADERLIAWESRVRFVPYSLARQMGIQFEAALQNTELTGAKRPV